MTRKEPTYERAIEAGIRDTSYSTVRWGTIPCFSGEVFFSDDDGVWWRAIGHGPRGSAERVTAIGWIEFQRLEEVRA